MSTPYEDKRRTNSLDVRRANIYKRIAKIYDQLGDEFKSPELYALTGIKKMAANKSLVASVLIDSFKCILVGHSTNRRWKKGTP